MNQKLLFFTDIHGSLYAMKEILRVIDEEKPDKVVFLGDLLYHGPRNPFPKEYNPMGVAEAIKSLTVPSVLVKGNCDSEVDEMVIERKFQVRKTINIDGLKIICTHGHKLDKLNCKGAFAVIYGHYHVNKVTENNGVYFVNLSSVSLPKEGNAAAYAVYLDKKMTLKSLDGEQLFEIKGE